MTAPSPLEFREAVRSQTDIVSLIGETVSLQPRHGGRQYVGLCPFHDDHNPSLNVNPDRQTFRCWSCNTFGDCFGFLMEREKITFPEALEILARRANIPIPPRRGAATQEQESNRAKIFEVLQWAENEFHKALLELPAAEPARRYLSERGFTPEIIRDYRLGYHPDNWTWLIDRAASRYSPKLLVEARLAGEKEGRHFDAAFSINRVLFPIRNERGQPVSFGGRILPGSAEAAKYINGSESMVFHKSRLLYGIDKARDAIHKVGRVLVVEGYTDCITCHQHGVLNVVGTLGTALTDSHVTALKRFTQHVVLAYDGDDAGQDAARRAVERFLAQDVDLRILTLPDRLDPAEYLAAHSADELRNLIEAAPEAWEYQFRSTRAVHGLETIAGRQRVFEEMLELLAQAPYMSGTLRESLLIANLAQRLAVTERAARDHLSQVRGRRAKRMRVDQAAAEETPHTAQIERMLRGRMLQDDRLECDLLELLLAAPEHVGFIARSVPSGSLRNGILGQVLNHCLLETEELGELTLVGLISRVDDRELRNLIGWIDEQSRNKDLSHKLNDSGYDDEGCPLLLRRTLEKLTWREAEQSHQLVAVQLSQTAGAGDLNDATELLLRQAEEFHRKRAT